MLKPMTMAKDWLTISKVPRSVTEGAQNYIADGQKHHEGEGRSSDMIKDLNYLNQNAEGPSASLMPRPPPQAFPCSSKGQCRRIHRSLLIASL